MTNKINIQAIKNQDKLINQIASYVAIASFTFVSLIASGFVEMLDDIFKLRGPALSYISFAFSVYWFPVILFIIWFNTISEGCGKFKIVIPKALIAGATALFVMIFLESYHALMRDKIPDFEICFCWTWVLFLFLALSSFNYGKVNWLEVTIVVIAICSSVICFFVLIFPIYSPRDLGIANFFSLPNRPLWSGVNSNSYFSALIFVIALYKILYCKLNKYRSFFWLGMSGVNLMGIIINKARGAWMATLLTMAMMLLHRIAISKARKIILASIILGISIVIIFIICTPINIESFLSFGRGLTAVKTRLSMFSTAFEIFLKSPLIGIGWAQVLEYKVAGHAIHGVIQTVAAAYGMIGLILLFSIIYFSLPKKINLQNSMMIIPVACITTTSAIALMTPPFWFAIVLLIFYLIKERGDKTNDGK